MRNDPEARPKAASPAEQANDERFYEGFFERESALRALPPRRAAVDLGEPDDADES